MDTGAILLIWLIVYAARRLRGPAADAMSAGNSLIASRTEEVREELARLRRRRARVVRFPGKETAPAENAAIPRRRNCEACDEYSAARRDDPCFYYFFTDLNGRYHRHLLYRVQAEAEVSVN